MEFASFPSFVYVPVVEPTAEPAPTPKSAPPAPKVVLKATPAKQPAVIAPTVVTSPPTQKSPIPERRRSARQTIVAKAMLRVEGRNASPVRRIALQNLSLLGAMFMSGEKMNVGDKATLRFEVGPLKWSGVLRIIHCIPQGKDRYAIGCAFVGNELHRAAA